MLKPERLSETFLEFIRIDSPSREEWHVAVLLKERLEALGGKVFFDDSEEKTGSSSGNLIALFDGIESVSPLLLSAHMDTVEPGRGIRPLFEDGIFRSSGDTILGADDKSGIAVILEVLESLREDGKAHGPIELAFSVCEEIGLLGAKCMQKDLLRSTFGYVLDSMVPDGIVTRAPAANRFRFEVHGLEAHAGGAPEKGINAIKLAAKAIARCPDGRIDEETTCNIGKIEGGVATNIVASSALVLAEARSHDPEKLRKLTQEMVSAFQDTVDEAKKSGKGEFPSLTVHVEEDFTRLFVPESSRAVEKARIAAKNLGRELPSCVTGGGSDANIFFAHGIEACVLGTGMRDAHTLSEHIALSDMMRCAELVQEIILEQAKTKENSHG